MADHHCEGMTRHTRAPPSKIPKPRGTWERKHPLAGCFPETFSPETLLENVAAAGTLHSSPAAHSSSGGTHQLEYLGRACSHSSESATWQGAGFPAGRRGGKRSPQCPAVFGNPIQEAAYGSVYGSAVV